MTRSLSGDLRGRGLSQSRMGFQRGRRHCGSGPGFRRPGVWYRRYRETGEMDARKPGQPSRSKLDAPEAFILGLIEDARDITLAEIGERLVAERDVGAAPSTVWLFLDRRDITLKKDGARLGAAVP